MLFLLQISWSLGVILSAIGFAIWLPAPLSPLAAPDITAAVGAVAVGIR
jgi:hypothetical protein